MPDAFAIVFVTILGLMVGSFLNVCIARLPLGQSIVTPRSRCPQCETPIAGYDNIPVLSFILLGGRCRACRTRISIVYPVVEVVTALLFAAHYVAIGWQPLLVSRLVLASALVALFAIDLEHRILPNVITLSGIIVGFLFSFIAPPGPLSAAAGVFIGGGTLLAIAEGYYRLRHEEGLGMGDVKMLAMIGAFLGWQLTLLTLVLSSLVGSVVGAAVILSRRGDMKYALPFGTFLALAALVASLAGDRIVAWYLSYY
jgi:leader peptidase (prepilin peptidase)/N-methyltransferase